MQNVISTERLAKKAIQLLEKAIKDDFGLQVKVGAELEYFLKDENGKPIYLGLDRNAKADGTKKYFLAKDVGHARDSHFIRSHYSESPLGQYEVTFSHEPEHNHGGAVLADAIAQTKEIIKREAKREFAAEPYFNSVNGDFVSGLQISVSLWDGNENILARKIDESHKNSVYAADMIASAMLPGIDQNLLCFVPNKPAIRRYGLDRAPGRINANNNGIVGALLTKDVSDNQLARIENRLPGADASPHLAILGTLYAVYQGLKLKRDVPDHALLQSMQNTGKAEMGHIPRDFDDIIGKFASDSFFIETIDKLSEGQGLGSRLHERIIQDARNPSGPAVQVVHAL